MDALYSYIIDGLQKTGYFYKYSPEYTFDKYLRDLQDSVIQLRKAFRSDSVIVDYSDPNIQAAYLITYYPHYVEMTVKILSLLSSELTFDSELNVCFFGAGPCPEISALVKFLSKQNPSTTKLTANVYDIASETWGLSRKVTENHIVPKLWKGKTELHSNKFDLCLKNCFCSIKSVIENSSIFIFQNCLNELYDVPNVKENIDLLLDYVPQDRCKS